MRFNFEHALLLVRTCDILPFFNSLIIRMYQVGSVGTFFFIFLSSSLGESDVLKRLCFL